jgi:hypothetical protein
MSLYEGDALSGRNAAHLRQRFATQSISRRLCGTHTSDG